MYSVTEYDAFARERRSVFLVVVDSVNFLQTMEVNIASFVLYSPDQLGPPWLRESRNEMCTNMLRIL